MKSEAFKRIEQMDDAAGRLGFEIAESIDSYDDIGSDIFYLVNKHPEHFELIEKVIIAVCGYGFDSLERKIKEDATYYDSL